MKNRLSTEINLLNQNKIDVFITYQLLGEYVTYCTKDVNLNDMVIKYNDMINETITETKISDFIIDFEELIEDTIGNLRLYIECHKNGVLSSVDYSVFDWYVFMNRDQIEYIMKGINYLKHEKYYDISKINEKIMIIDGMLKNNLKEMIKKYVEKGVKFTELRYSNSPFYWNKMAYNQSRERGCTT